MKVLHILKDFHNKIIGFAALITIIFMAGAGLVKGAASAADPSAASSNNDFSKSASEATSSALDVASGSALDVNADVTINARSRKMGIGESFKLKLEGLDKDTEVKWKSTNKKIVTVTKKGKVHALSAGKVYVKADIGSKTLKCKVTVMNKGLEFAEYTMSTGETLMIHISKYDKVKWSASCDPETGALSSKSNGFARFTAKSEGSAVIKAKADGKTYYCNVKIEKSSKSVIYLTFDDGPSSYSTPKILDILKKNGINATFFTINFNADGQKLIARELKEGNAVAIHGYSHDYGKIYRSDAAYIYNIKMQQNKLYKTFGIKPWATRFPGGSSNLVSRHYNRGIMKRLVKKVEAMGYAYFDWNVSSGDSGGANNSSQVYANVTKGLKKNRNNIVLMHDFSGNNKTIGALDSIIKYGKSHGYVFKTIGNSTTPVHHGVQN